MKLAIVLAALAATASATTTLTTDLAVDLAVRGNGGHDNKCKPKSLVKSVRLPVVSQSYLQSTDTASGKASESYQAEEPEEGLEDSTGLCVQVPSAK